MDKLRWDDYGAHGDVPKSPQKEEGEQRSSQSPGRRSPRSSSKIFTKLFKKEKGETGDKKKKDKKNKDKLSKNLSPRADDDDSSEDDPTPSPASVRFGAILHDEGRPSIHSS